MRNVQTDASGEVVFDALSEGFWKVDAVESTSPDWDGTLVEDFWVVRIQGPADGEARTIEVPQS